MGTYLSCWHNSEINHAARYARIGIKRSAEEFVGADFRIRHAKVQTSAVSAIFECLLLSQHTTLLTYAVVKFQMFRSMSNSSMYVRFSRRTESRSSCRWRRVRQWRSRRCRDGAIRASLLPASSCPRWPSVGTWNADFLPNCPWQAVRVCLATLSSDPPSQTCL